MELPRGITGFIHRREQALFTQRTDLDLFLQYSYTVAVLCSGQITAINLRPTLCTNYGGLVMKMADASVAITINHIYPFIAFSSFSQASSASFLDGYLDFVDCEPLAERYGSFNRYQVLSAAQAKATPGRRMYKELSDREVKEINYWQPREVGQIIFNWWD